MTIISGLRRAAFALGLAGVIAGYLRLNNPEEIPSKDGGWRELSGENFE